MSDSGTGDLALSLLRRPAAGYGSLLEQLNREGDPLSVYGELSLTDMFNAGPSGQGRQAATGVPSPGGGRAIFVQSLNFSCRTPVVGRVTVGPTPGAYPGTGSTKFQDVMFECGPGYTSGDRPINTFVSNAAKGTVGAGIKRFFDPAGFNAALTVATATSGSPTLTNVTGAALVKGQMLQGNGLATNAYVTDVSGTTATMSGNATATGVITVAAPLFTAGGTAFELADSLNFDAKKVLLWIGTSILGTQTATTSRAHEAWLTSQYYRDQGISNRYILKAYGGWDSRGHETKRSAGDYNFPQLDDIFHDTTVNDAQNNVPPATVTGNADAFVKWKRLFYPKTRIIFLGGTPLLDNTNEARQVIIRQALSDYVSSLNDPLVKYYSQANAFDRTVAANYQAGDGIHPLDGPHLLNWNGGYNNNPGLRSFVDTNLKTI